MRDILDWPDPDNAGQTLASGLVDRLLRLPDELWDDLITCSAARDLADMPILRNLATHGQALSSFYSTDLWVVRPDDRLEAPPGDRRRRSEAMGAIHPSLRRVLHALAKRGENDPNRWHDVHRRLRDFYRDEHRNKVKEMYHALALGDLKAVVEYLANGFVRGSVTSWTGMLETITSAPLRPSPDRSSPAERVEALSDGDFADPVLAWLVPAVWFNHDLLGDPSCTLNLRIAHHFDRLSDRPNLTIADREALDTKANEYRDRCRGQSRRDV